MSTDVGERVGVGEHALSRKNWDIKDRNSSGYRSVREHRSTTCKVLALTQCPLCIHAQTGQRRVAIFLTVC